MFFRLALVTSVVALAAGCTGLLGGADAAGESATPSVGGYHLMRLTSAEYDNTVRDLLGDTTAPATQFSPDEKVGPFDANVLAPPSEVMLDDYMQTAEALAATAVADVGALTGCSDATDA